MNTYLKQLLIALLCLPLMLRAQSRQTINLGTYNLRLNVASDKENAWPNRKDMVIDLIRYHELDIFGVQEALKGQMDDLSSMPAYKYVGVGRDDGKTGGEYSAIFYRSDKFKVLNSGNFWLSPTPEKPSKGWDAAYIRICTWAAFQDLKSHKVFYMFNAHFDNEGVLARENAAKLILQKIGQLAKANTPVIITGDFNSDPSTSAYKTIANQFKDARLVTKTPAYGPDKTFNDFKYANYVQVVPEGRIDFVFVNKHIDVLKYGVLTDSKNERFPSDHFPVVTRLQF